MPTQPVYARLTQQGQRDLLHGIVRRCHDLAALQNRPSPVVVFDLDGTLVDNRPRSRAILRELAVRWKKQEPALAAHLLAVEPRAMAYHFKDSLDALGVTRDDLVREAVEHWQVRFFSDETLQHDVEVPGAAAFAQACYAAGATVVYLTGRDLPLMGLGTFRSLRDLGFPIGVPGSELVLKPVATMPDSEFKRFEAPKLARVGTIVASFDNEPENCNVFLGRFADAASVFLDTQHLAGAPPLGAGVKVIADFRTSDE